MTSNPLVLEEANIEELVNNLIEPSTLSTDKVELLELPKDSVLPTGFRFIDLSIRSDVSSLLACPLKLHDIEELATFIQIKCMDCKFKFLYFTSD